MPLRMAVCQARRLLSLMPILKSLQVSEPILNFKGDMMRHILTELRQTVRAGSIL